MPPDILEKPAPPPPLPTKLSIAPWWRGKEFGLAVIALIAALSSWVAGYAQSYSNKEATESKANFGYDALRSEVDRQSKVTTDLTNDVRAIRGWLVASLNVQQVSSPVDTTSTVSPAVVVTEPGAKTPSNRTLTPLARSVPPIPLVKASPSPPALPRSLDQLVDPAQVQINRNATAKE